MSGGWFLIAVLTLDLFFVKYLYGTVTWNMWNHPILLGHCMYLSPKLDPYLGGPCCSMLDCLCFRDCHLLQGNKYYGFYIKVFLNFRPLSRLSGIGFGILWSSSHAQPVLQVPQSSNAFNALLAACEKAEGASVYGRSIALLGVSRSMGGVKSLPSAVLNAIWMGEFGGAKFGLNQFQWLKYVEVQYWNRIFKSNPYRSKPARRGLGP